MSPGDLVQLDTLDIRPLPGAVLKQFTARDVICRWDVLDIYRQATSVNAAHLLDAVDDEVTILVYKDWITKCTGYKKYVESLRQGE